MPRPTTPLSSTSGWLIKAKLIMKKSLNAWRVLTLIALPLAMFGCTNVDRSRDVADPNVSGKTLALQVCAACHGVTGNSVSPQFPKLAQQQPDYLVEQIKNFRNHQRSDELGVQHMWGLAANLSDAQITQIAEYFSSQISEPNTGDPDPAQLIAGKEIYLNGRPTQGTPPCVMCHGQKGEGMGQFPRLAYQHANYIERQLQVFQNTDGRPNTPMSPISHPLTPDEMKAVAVFLEAFPK